MQRMRLDSLQILRCVAAVVVVFAHAISRLVRVFPALAPTSFFMDLGGFRDVGHAGVDIFFVISGFIMLYVHYDDFARPDASMRFLTRRIIRIVPLYWALTTFAVILLAVVPQVFSYRSHVDPLWVLGSYAFIPIRSSDGVLTPVIGMGWTLNYEMYFYAVFATLIVFPRGRAIKAMSALFAGCVAIGMLTSPANLWLQLLTNWLLLEFLLGVLIALYLRTHAPGPRVYSWLLVGAGSVAILLTSYSIPSEGWSRFFFWGLPAAMIVAGIAQLTVDTSRPVGRLFARLGDASYSIYLFQAFALPGIALLMRSAGAQRILPFDAMVLVLTLVSTLCGFVVWYLLEAPLTTYLRKRFTRPRRQAEPKRATSDSDAPI